MDKSEIISGLESFKQRLSDDVERAYKSRGATHGDERFDVWKAKFSKFLDSHLPKATSRLNAKLYQGMFTVIGDGESDFQIFWRENGEICVSFIDSLVADVKNDEYDFEQKPSPLKKKKMRQSASKDINNKVFIVHGHDESMKTEVARFVEKLGFEAVILHEQASGGKTIIEKLETYTNVGFAIILYTPDDVGRTRGAVPPGEEKNRARQNVIFEHGYLIAKLGRGKVVSLVVGEIEMPSDVNGIVFVANTNWQNGIAREMKQAGYAVDFNKLLA